MSAVQEVLVSVKRASVVVTVGLLLLVPGCWAKDPCGPGFVIQPNYTCQAIALPADAGSEGAAPDAAPVEGGTSSEAGAPEAAAPSSFGKTCAAMTDCGGDAPICGAPQLPYCTQINCQLGEANAGACPADYTCFTAPGYPSACLRN